MDSSGLHVQLLHAAYLTTHGTLDQCFHGATLHVIATLASPMNSKESQHYLIIGDTNSRLFDRFW